MQRYEKKMKHANKIVIVSCIIGIIFVSLQAKLTI